MKIVLLFISVFIIIGCGGIHVPFSYAKDDDVLESKKGSFVLLRNGERVTGKNIQWKGKSLIVDNSRKIDEDDVSVYQSGEMYFARTSNKDGGLQRRIVKGKINVYKLTGPYSSDRSSNIYFIQKGPTGEVVNMTPKALQIMTADNEEVLKKANKLGNFVVNIPKMESVIKLYNED